MSEAELVYRMSILYGQMRPLPFSATPVSDKEYAVYREFHSLNDVLYKKYKTVFHHYSKEKADMLVAEYILLGGSRE